MLILSLTCTSGTLAVTGRRANLFYCLILTEAVYFSKYLNLVHQELLKKVGALRAPTGFDGPDQPHLGPTLNTTHVLMSLI